VARGRPVPDTNTISISYEGQYDLRPSAARFLTVLPNHKAELVEAAAKAFTITGIADCCAPATSGHTAAAPPSSVMNARLFTRSPRRLAQAERLAFGHTNELAW
jgi:hypothetical protein